jgi:hypothetical protein
MNHKWFLSRKSAPHSSALLIPFALLLGAATAQTPHQKNDAGNDSGKIVQELVRAVRHLQWRKGSGTDERQFCLCFQGGSVAGHLPGGSAGEESELVSVTGS